MPSSVVANFSQLKDPILLPQQPLHQHGNTLATSHTGSVTTTTSVDQPRLSLPPVTSMNAPAPNTSQPIVVHQVGRNGSCTLQDETGRVPCRTKRVVLDL